MDIMIQKREARSWEQSLGKKEDYLREKSFATWFTLKNITPGRYEMLMKVNAKRKVRSSPKNSTRFQARCSSSNPLLAAARRFLIHGRYFPGDKIISEKQHFFEDKITAMIR